MQNDITSKGPLLNSDGNLREKGYSRKMLLEYNRNDIKAKKMRIKEWDYYLIHNQEYGICLTLDENGYPPVPSDEVFKEIFEQAENFKKYN